jgi:Fic family protein
MTSVRYHEGMFPPRSINWSKLVPLIGPATAAIGRYDGLLAAIPNSSVLLSPLSTQEAVLSSRIEGTQATLGEVLQYDADEDPLIDPAKKDDINEVLNYRRALKQAEQELHELPLCNRLIKRLDATLMNGVRGHDQARGQFRTIQNYIGVYGRPIKEAHFVPIVPDHPEEGMRRWEEYTNDKTDDLLVRLACVHAEFESLHPFLD